MTLMSLITDLANFGTAGLMGAMWLAERRLNRTREEQLIQAHNRILRDEQKLNCLTDVVNRNTAAIVRFVQHQKQQSELIKHLMNETHHTQQR